MKSNEVHDIIHVNDKEKLIDTHFFVKYHIVSNSGVHQAAWDIALGQSIGNPNVRNEWETRELIENHSCKIVNIKGSRDSTIEIAFPYINLDWKTDGVAQLLCMIQGGHTDIDHIYKCKIIDIEAPKLEILKPKYGITGFREFLGIDSSKPFLGGIVKPKTGISKEVLLEMVKQMVEGGVDFIKEDEILSSPSFCKIEERVPLIMNYLYSINRKVIYSVCINSDPAHLLERVKLVHKLGGNSVHVNVWSGLGSYKSIRELDLPIFLHYQKSGIESITSRDNPYSISWNVLCKLAGMCGVDSIHAGMIGGYSENSDIETTIKTLRSYNVIPALSCGMHPGLVKYVTDKVGNDYMANVGGAIHGHPGGTMAGAKAMRQAIDKTFGTEYGQAIETWGFKKE